MISFSFGQLSFPLQYRSLQFQKKNNGKATLSHNFCSCFLLTDPVKKVVIGVSNLTKSLDYWKNLLGMTVFEQTDMKALLGYDPDKCKLELIHLGHPVDHATAFGRIAFSCPRDQLRAIEGAIKEAGHTILTPLVSLDTPGKATVEVVILADPVMSPFHYQA